MELNQIIVSIIWLIILGITSYLDIKTRKIPVFIYPATGAVSVIVNISILGFEKNYLISAGLGLAIMFMIMLIIAIFCGGGGADILLMAALGASITIKYCFEILIIAYIPFVFASIFFVYKRRNLSKEEKKEKKVLIPFVPFIAFGFIVDLIINIII